MRATIFHRSRRRLIVLVSAEHDDLERVVGQWHRAGLAQFLRVPFGRPPTAE
jgi:hypothetical protein